jgi:hypothetical protein
VRAVHVRVDQGDRERLDPRLDEVANDPLDLRHVDGRDRLAARVQPLDGLARVREGGRRVGLDHDDPPSQRAGSLGAREVQDLLEPLRRDQPDTRAFRLEHGVRGHGRPVEDVAHLADVDAGLFADAANAGQHPLRRIRRRRRGLDAVAAAAVTIAVADQEEVGERSPHIDAQPVSHSLSFIGFQPETGANAPAR